MRHHQSATAMKRAPVGSDSARNGSMGRQQPISTVCSHIPTKCNPYLEWT